jgi:hypothetical protein
MSIQYTNLNSKRHSISLLASFARCYIGYLIRASYLSLLYITSNYIGHVTQSSPRFLGTAGLVILTLYVLRMVPMGNCVVFVLVEVGVAVTDILALFADCICW